MNNIDFEDFVSDLNNKLQFVMNKFHIKDFIKQFEDIHKVILFDKIEETEEFYASSLLNIYIENTDIIFDDYKNTIQHLIG